MKLSLKSGLVILAVGAMVLIAQQTPRKIKHERVAWRSEGDDQAYAIVSGDSLNMNGSSSDARRARLLQDRIQGDYIWFERDLKFYYVTDPAVVARAKSLFAPQEELGRQQAELGEKQAKLGDEMSRVTIRADLAPQMEELKKQIQALQARVAAHADFTQEDLGDLQGKLGEMQSRIGDLQSKAGDQQAKIGEKQGALGEQQGKLGEEQGRLAEIASGKMKGLLDQAIHDGLASPVK